MIRLASLFTVLSAMYLLLGLVVVTTLSSCQGATGACECPIGWTRLDTACYKYVAAPRQWLDAEDNCQRHGGRLAIPKSHAKDLYIKTLATMNTNSDNVWVGGLDDVKDGVWRWPITDDLFTYTDWSHGEPDGSKTNEDCLMMQGSKGFKWADDSCDQERAFICEKDIRST